MWFQLWRNSIENSSLRTAIICTCCISDGYIWWGYSHCVQFFIICSIYHTFPQMFQSINIRFNERYLTNFHIRCLAVGILSSYVFFSPCGWNLLPCEHKNKVISSGGISTKADVQNSNEIIRLIKMMIRAR